MILAFNFAEQKWFRKSSFCWWWLSNQDRSLRQVSLTKSTALRFNQNWFRFHRKKVGPATSYTFEDISVLKIILHRISFRPHFKNQNVAFHPKLQKAFVRRHHLHVYRWVHPHRFEFGIWTQSPKRVEDKRPPASNLPTTR